MRKYFDGYASFEWNKMSNQKLVVELKEKCSYIAELKQIHKEQISKIQSSRDKLIADIQSQLAEKDKTIAELEEQLKKKPKYNIGDRVYIINEDYEVERDFIESIDIDTDGIEYYTETYSICWYENQFFATKAEAEAKLRELGEKK